MTKLTVSLIIIIFVGCSSISDRGQEEIDKLPWRNDQIDPAPQPEPADDLQIDGFLWDPGPDSVRIVIPASLPHNQLHLFTLNTHHIVYGPDHSGRGRAGEVEYILPGSGADWQALATVTCPKGYPAIMVYLNTDALQSNGHRSAGWRILCPTFVTVGSRTTRLQPNENK